VLSGRTAWLVAASVEMGNPVTLAGNTLVTSSACGLAYGIGTSSGAIL
jgi:hypothetical protein